MMPLPASRGAGSGGPPMPRYYFNLYNDAFVPDEEGMELPDIEAARAEAGRGVRSLICEQVHQGRITLGHRIEVEDEVRRKVLVVAFGDVVQIED